MFNLFDDNFDVARELDKINRKRTNNQAYYYKITIPETKLKYNNVNKTYNCEECGATDISVYFVSDDCEVFKRPKYCPSCGRLAV